MISAMPRIAIAVQDFSKAVDTFREVLGMPVLDFSARTVESLGAHVGMCVPEGGSNIELMAPATPDTPLAKSIQGFLDRKGEGLFALMLEAADPNTEADAVLTRGLDVLPLMEGAHGRDIHPRSNHGVLIRIYPDNSVEDQGPHEIREPGLYGIARVVVATTDAEQAAKAYGHGLGLRLDSAVIDSDRGALSVRCHPPKGGIIELVSVVDDTKLFGQSIARSVADKGEGMFALVLQAADAERASEVLTGRGLAVQASSGMGSNDVAEVNVFGTRILIEQAAS